MALTTAGLNFITQQLVAPGTNFNEYNAYIGVGDGTAIFAADQTDLQGVNTHRQAMDATYPKVNGSTITFRATFPATVANFTWNEWGVFNAASDGVMLCRLVEYNSTKLDNQEWVMEVTIPLIIP